MRACTHFKTIDLKMVEENLQYILPTRLLLCHNCEPKLSEQLESLSLDHLKSLVAQKNKAKERDHPDVDIRKAETPVVTGRESEPTPMDL
jgi:hypothetical protein